MIELFYVICGITGLVLLLFFFESYDNYIVEEDYDISTGDVFMNDNNGELVIAYTENNINTIQGNCSPLDNHTYIGKL